MKHAKTVASIQTGEYFVECPKKYWAKTLAKARRDTTEPWPMPVGHDMFRRPQPDKYRQVPDTILE